MTLDSSQWLRRFELFHRALELPESERAAFLAAECSGEPDVLTDVLDLLEADVKVHPLLDEELAAIADDLLDGSEPPHETIGPYRLKGILGKGGMGIVYLAERENLQHVVAIKVLRDAQIAPARRERFEREKRTLAKLSHPSIPRLYAADVLEDGTSYIIMEYVDGVPISTYCDLRDASIHERLHLFRQVCEAVQYAHGQAVLHLDLKPTNILVSEDGLVRLLDFGISRQVEGSAATDGEFRLLTPTYAAPEQLRGEPLGVYTDVFALGAILYELLTGTRHRATGEVGSWTPDDPNTEPPHIERASVAARRLGRRRTARRAGRSIGRVGWADLDALCMKAMHHDPRQRYLTVESLQRDLEHFARKEPLQARRPTFRYRIRQFLRRNNRPVAALLVTGLIFISLATFYTLELTDERNRARAAAARAEEVSDYLIQLFETGDPYERAAGSTGDSISVRTLLERGVERAEALSEQPAAQAQMLDVLGRVHTVISRYDEAEALLERALAIRRGLDSPLDVAETMANLGDLHSYRGDYESAEASLAEALQIRQRHLPPNDAALARTFDKLAVVLNRQGEYVRAEALYRLGLRIQRTIFTEPDRSLATTLNNLAVNQFDQGKYDAAERYYREALAIERPLLGNNHPSLAVGLANLGVLLETRGNFGAADSALTEALRIKRKALGDDHYETAFSLTQLGGMLRRKGDHERAEAYLKEALAIEERVLGPNHRNTAVTLNHLALSLQDREEFDAAEPLLRRSAAIFSESLGGSHPFTGISLCHLAHLQHLRGSIEASESGFDECLTILETTLPAGHDVLAMNRSKYGALLTDLGRFDEAEPILISSHHDIDAHFGRDHPDTRRAAQRLIALYEAWGRPSAADQFRDELAAAPMVGN